MRTVTVTLPAPTGRPLLSLSVTHARTGLGHRLEVGDQVLLVDAADRRPARAGTVTRVDDDATGPRYEIACGVSDLLWTPGGPPSRPAVRHRPTSEGAVASVQTADVVRLLRLLRDRDRRRRRTSVLAPEPARAATAPALV